MPKAASAAGTGTPVSGDHSNATEISAPVVEEESIETPIGDPSQLGSHREEAEPPDSEVDTTDESEGEVDVPARLKGKPLSQVYREFTGLEQDRSRLGNELGEARALLRQALESALKVPGAKVSSDELPEPTDEEFDTDPRGAAKKLVAKEVQPLKDAVLSAEQRAATLEFESVRPGYQKEVATPEFQEWVRASAYRQRMFKAAANYDLEAAADLFAMYDAQKPAAGEEDETSAEKKKTAIKRVTTETGGAGKSAGGKSGKKIYKSTDLMRLRIQDPERYTEMGPEIRAAFQEGRVR